MSYSSDEAEAASVIGASGGVSGNFSSYSQEVQALYQRMADYLNSKGGLGGCKISIAYYDFHTLGSDGFAGESQTECVDFAQDQHAFAVVSAEYETKTVITCLAQNHVVDFYNSTIYQPTAQDFKTYQGYLYQPDWISSGRFKSFISILSSAGYFGTGAKVGILLADDGSGNNQSLVNNLWKPALEAMGITPTVFTFREVESESEASGTTSQFQSAVLQFESAGINRVIMTPDSANAIAFFTQVAQSENYHPRYAMSSDNNPYTWDGAPAGQRAGAMDVSYSLNDTRFNPEDSQTNSNPNDATRATCKSIYGGHTGSVPVVAMYQACDDFLFLQTALSSATSVTPAALLAGAGQLRTPFPLANDFGNASIGPPDRYDGGSSVRVMAWNESANEWQYAGPPVSVP